MEFEEFKNQKSEKLIKVYRKYVFDKLKERSINNYCTSLRNINSYLIEALDFEEDNNKLLYNILDKARKKLPFKIEKKKKDYLFLIGWYLYNGDKLYAMTIYDFMYNFVKTTKDEISTNNKVSNNKTFDLKKISDSLAAFNYLQDFLIFYDIKNQKNDNNLDKHKEEADNFANGVREKINKKDLHKLDGMDPLIAQLKTEGFIKLAIESSYFFRPELVQNQKIDITKARHTTDSNINPNDGKKGETATYRIYEDEKKYNEYHVEIDKDNNAAVRSLIKEKTGLSVSEGKSSILQNTVISHVWGRAYDPRYFTSLWNIVLIPAWANSLMDKEDAEPESLASKMRATFMAVCAKLYSDIFKNHEYWENLNMETAPLIQNSNDIIGDNYTIYLLQEKASKAIQITQTQVSFKSQ